MKKAGRPSEGKVRVSLTLTPDFMEKSRELDPNLSRFVEMAGWKEIKRKRHYRATERKSNERK